MGIKYPSDLKINIVEYYVNLLAYWTRVSDCCPSELLVDFCLKNAVKATLLIGPYHITLPYSFAFLMD